MTPVPGYPGYYVDTHGNVYSTRVIGSHNPEARGPARRLTPSVGNHGYLRVRCSVAGGPRRMECVHALMALAFLTRPTIHASRAEVRHLDGNPLNNTLTNLAWGTSKDNSQDAIRHGTTCRGERHGASKLTATDVQGIRRMIAAGQCATHIAVRYKVSVAAIYSIRSGRTWAWLTASGMPDPENES